MHRRNFKVFEQHQTCTGIAPNCLSFVSAWLPLLKISFRLCCHKWNHGKCTFGPNSGSVQPRNHVTFWKRATVSKCAFARRLSTQMRPERSIMHRRSLWCSASAQTCTGVVFGYPRALKCTQVLCLVFRERSDVHRCSV